MRAKDYLLQIEAMNARINAGLEELAQLKALAEKTTTTFGGERVQSSSSQQRMADCVVKIHMKKEELEAEIDRFVDFKDEARKLVFASCDPDCVTLLTKRYFGELNTKTEEIEYKTWEQISVEMNRSYKNVCMELHGRALSQFQKGLDKSEKNKKGNRK